MTRQELMKRIKNSLLLGDGAMGTMLAIAQPGAECPEILNLTHPETVRSVHEAYVNAGSDMIQTNTFGGNPVKLSAHGLSHQTNAINGAAVRIARQAAGSGRIVAGGIGPTGKLLKPMGAMAFQEAVSAYFEQAKSLASAGCDVFLIETMSDIQEARAAVIGAKKAADLPILCSMTFDSRGRTLTGSDPVQVITVLEALGVDVAGANCGTGPEMMASIIQQMRQVTELPLLAQANAGLPVLRDGATHYDMGPDQMASRLKQLIAAGATFIGGCCGTTPEHIAAFHQVMNALSPAPVKPFTSTKLAGTQRTIIIDSERPTPLIGENINPTARRTIREAYLHNDHDPIVKEAIRQVKAGASVIDVNAGVPGIDQEQVMPVVMEKVQQAVPVPLSIDATDPRVIAAGLQVVRGKPLINSANGEPKLLEQMVDLAVTYGAALLCLTLDEKGIPDKAEERLAIAGRMVETAVRRGMRREDILIDPLTLTAGAQQILVPETLRAIRLIKDELGVKTILGVSNISHGLPERKPINATFLAMALAAGLDLPIMNPCEPVYLQTIAAADVLNGKDRNARSYIAQMTQNVRDGESAVVSPDKQATAKVEPAEKVLYSKILQGEKENIRLLVNNLLEEKWTGLDIIERVITPALTQVGEWYETGAYFLPQLLMAAESTQETFAAIKDQLPGAQKDDQGTIVMATVKGDVHDIGKNIVSVMMENHGFRVIDLGKDVAAEIIVETAGREKADLIGLSALMTTTMPQMALVAKQLEDLAMDIPVMVGGAVLNEEYAQSIGAHYAPDAVQAVKKAKSLLSGT